MGLLILLVSFFSPFHDSGSWGIYYACEPKNLTRVRDLVFHEYESVLREGFRPHKAETNQASTYRADGPQL